MEIYDSVWNSVFSGADRSCKKIFKSNAKGGSGMRNFKTERNYRTGMAAFALLCSLTLTACQGTQNTDGSSQKESTRDFFAMDTYMTFTAYGDGSEEALEKAEKEIQTLESEWSVTDENSEIY